MALEERAYLAGMIDGEGSILVYARRDTCTMRISVSNTCRALLEWIARCTEVGSIVTQRVASERHSASYHWQCYSEAAESILAQVRPYLIIKTAQADLALECQRRLHDPAMKADRSWQQEFVRRSKELNRRGPN